MDTCITIIDKFRWLNVIERYRIYILYRYMCVYTYRDRETKRRKITHRICKIRLLTFNLCSKMSTCLTPIFKLMTIDVNLMPYLVSYY